tara:strand:- start:828 stop:1028 length:201 start_codon:yes stop_codon:yes gene_type:complete
LTGSINAVFVVCAVFVFVAATAIEASAIGATCIRAALAIALASGAFIVFANLASGAVVAGIAHAVF